MSRTASAVKFYQLLDDLIRKNLMMSRGRGSLSLMEEDIWKYLTNIQAGKAPVRNKKLFEKALRAPSTKTRKLLEEGTKQAGKAERGGWTKEVGYGHRSREGWRPRYGAHADPYWGQLRRALGMYDEYTMPLIDEIMATGKQAGILPLLALMGAAGGGAYASQQ